MTENNEIKDIEVFDESDETPITPYVNEKVKIYLVVFVILLAVASSLLVIFCSETPESETENKANPEILKVAQVLNT